MKALRIACLFAFVFLAPAHLGAPARAPEGLVLEIHQAEARRFGGFRSFGFRGSRGLGGFSRRGFSRRSFGTRPRPRAFSRRPFQRSSFLGGGFGSGLFAGIGGFLLGGMLGRMLFGGMGYGGMGLGGGLGILEIVLIGALVFFIFRMMRNRATASHAVPRYAEADPYGVGGYEERAGRESPDAYERADDVYRGPDIGSGRGGGGGTATSGAPRRDARTDRELRAMGEADASFSEQAFLGLAKENFIRFQAAWSARDIGPVRELTDDEIFKAVQSDIDDLKREGKINRLENVQIERAEIVEAWNEEGYDFITVRYEASVCDYVVCEKSGELLEGSRTERVRFSEHWTWVRPEGPNRWFLSAIEQA